MAADTTTTAEPDPVADTASGAEIAAAINAVNDTVRALADRIDALETAGTATSDTADTSGNSTNSDTVTASDTITPKFSDVLLQRIGDKSA